MDPHERVRSHTDPDRVATMYGELGNKLVRVSLAGIQLRPSY